MQLWLGLKSENELRINLRSIIGLNGMAPMVRMLKNTIEWSTEGYQWKPDDKHAKELFEQMNLDKAKECGTPGTKATAKNLTDSEEIIEDATSFQRGAGKRLYHTQDDPRVLRETSTVLSGMAKPRVLDQARVVRLVRYRKGTPGVVWKLNYQKPPVRQYALADADNASDEETRRSPSSHYQFVGNHLGDAEARRLQVTALSSGESEYYSVCLGGAAAIMLSNVGHVIGFIKFFVELWFTIYSDSSAERGICRRSDVGKLKHMQVRHLWIQERIENKETAIDVVDTSLNRADFETKYLDGARRRALIGRLPLLKERGLELVVASLTLAVPITGDEAKVKHVSIGKRSEVEWKDAIIAMSLAFGGWAYFVKKSKDETDGETEAFYSKGEEDTSGETWDEDPHDVADVQLEIRLKRLWLNSKGADSLRVAVKSSRRYRRQFRLTMAVMIDILMQKGVKDSKALMCFGEEVSGSEVLL